MSADVRGRGGAAPGKIFDPLGGAMSESCGAGGGCGFGGATGGDAVAGDLPAGGVTGVGSGGGDRGGGVIGAAAGRLTGAVADGDPTGGGEDAAAGDAGAAAVVNEEEALSRCAHGCSALAALGIVMMHASINVGAPRTRDWGKSSGRGNVN